MTLLLGPGDLRVSGTWRIFLSYALGPAGRIALL